MPAPGDVPRSPGQPGVTLTGDWDPAEASTAAPVSGVLPHSFVLAAGLAWPAGFALLDDFEVEGILGQGGMGVVYRVRQLSTGRSLAVKRARFTEVDSKRRFLAELQLWMDLPVHPHLAPCRFFRTVDDEVVIFTDLAAGGSLLDWIVRGQLCRAIDILDVAIQVARGLHALHERGLVHQDVKPANVLMTAEGIAQVTDFGLARARARLLQTATAEEGQSVLYSSGAMTPAYCSPEQELRRPVSRRTDIWSWGVLVLEMFAGRVPCCETGGPRAARTLERYRRDHGSPLREPMPASVAEVLELCFHADPAGRWSSLAEVEEMLAGIYRDLAGHDYPRPPIYAAADHELLPAERLACWSGRWEPPRKFLTLAYQAAGRDPTEVEAVLPPPASSRKAQAVADLAVYEEARVLVEHLLRAGQSDLEPRLAALLVQKALVHVSVSDWTEAVDLFDQAIELWQRLVYQVHRYELTPALLRTLLRKADALRCMGKHAEAVSLCDRVVTTWGRLDNRRARRELRDDVASAYLEKGLALRSMGKARQALVLFGKAIDIWQQLVDQDEPEGPANDLAQACLCKASVLSSLGQATEALELCDRAIQIRRRLVQRQGRRDLRGDLARAYLHKANVMRNHEEGSAALPLFEQAIVLLQRCVHEEGRDDLAQELARAFLARSGGERTHGDPRRAPALAAEAAAIWETLVHREGRRELTQELARAYQQQAHALRVTGELDQALQLCERAVELWERLVYVEGRAELTNDLARGYAARASVLRHRGQYALALEWIERAMDLRRQLLAQTGRDDIPGDLARDRVVRAEVLLDMGLHDEGKKELATAVQLLEDLVAQAPRADLRGVLNRARRRLQQLG
jgi:tetratricopeptide (TPR) repeat protein